jgi:hypothetical protein
MIKKIEGNIIRGGMSSPEEMERETGFEPATFSLGRRHATTALLPLGQVIFYFYSLWM